MRRTSGLTAAVPVSGKKLSERAYEPIKSDIIEGRLDPGGLLDEAFISKRCGMGRTPGIRRKECGA